MENKNNFWNNVLEYIKTNWLKWLTLGLTTLLKYLNEKRNEKK